METIKNQPRRAGTLAGRKEFKEDCRYAIAPVYTRVDTVEWMVWDAHVLDDVTGYAGIIRQASSREEAIKGLNFPGI